MNLIIHKWKPYQKGNTFKTIWFFTYLNYDAIDWLNRAAKKIDYLLYTKPRQDELKKASSNRASQKRTWKKV